MKTTRSHREAPIHNAPTRQIVGAFILGFGAFLIAGKLVAPYGEQIAHSVWRVIDPVQHHVPTSTQMPVTPIARQIEA